MPSQLHYLVAVLFCPKSDDYFCDTVCNYNYCIERLTYCTRMFVTTINLMFTVLTIFILGSYGIKSYALQSY